MKMRLAWYAGASTALAAAVVLSAFWQRANFYSAMVHLAQSSLSLMILVNLVFLIYGSFMYGLQRLCFGQLRPVEIEQLYEKAWFAVTETCLAMTIFREEVGAFFLVMFTALVTGKVWGWIGEGRIEILEQQPPANPWLFHTRLSVSLLLSVAYDCWLLYYAVNTVVQQARPTMMVMFLFEFAVLTVSSLHTACRYLLSLAEQQIVKTQTRIRIEELRRAARERRAEILRQRETEGAGAGANQGPLPDEEEEVDESEVEVSGWETKGQWVLTLDLVADFVKLGIYTAFFCVLFTFYGLPIHIMRDWFMTIRSFFKRLNALYNYHQALRNMNQFADASAEEIQREDTCIICREEMHPWDPNRVGQIERTRPKKLPCGHILHLGCLKSWLERQQVCPTCRRPVIRNTQPAPRNGDAMVFRFGLNLPGGQNQQGAQQPADGQAPGGQAGQGAQNGQPNNRNGVRMFNFGPLRLGFAQGGMEDIQDMAQRLGLDGHNPPATPPVAPPVPEQRDDNAAQSLELIQRQLAGMWQRAREEMHELEAAAREARALHPMVQELARLRQVQQQAAAAAAQQAQHPRQQPQQETHGGAPGVEGEQPGPRPAVQPGAQPLFQPGFQHGPQAAAQPGPQFIPPPGLQPGFVNPLNPMMGQLPMTLPHGAFPPPPFPMPSTFMHMPHTRPGAQGFGASIPSGSPDLPEGVVLPPGWSLLPIPRPLGTAGVNGPAGLNGVFASGQAQPAPSGTNSTAAAQSGQEQMSTPSSTRAEPFRAMNIGRATSSTGVTAGEGSSRAEATPRVPQAPNWGGPSQIVGQTSAPASSGASAVQNTSSSTLASHPPSSTPEQSGIASGTQTSPPSDGGEGIVATGDKGKGVAAPQEDTDGSAIAGSSQESSNDGSTDRKGKGRSATVEEADED